MIFDEVEEKQRIVDFDSSLKAKKIVEGKVKSK